MTEYSWEYKDVPESQGLFQMRPANWSNKIQNVGQESSKFKYSEIIQNRINQKLGGTGCVDLNDESMGVHLTGNAGDYENYLVFDNFEDFLDWLDEND